MSLRFVPPSLLLPQTSNFNSIKPPPPQNRPPLKDNPLSKNEAGIPILLLSHVDKAGTVKLSASRVVLTYYSTWPSVITIYMSVCTRACLVLLGVGPGLTFRLVAHTSSYHQGVGWTYHGVGWTRALLIIIMVFDVGCWTLGWMVSALLIGDFGLDA